MRSLLVLPAFAILLIVGCTRGDQSTDQETNGTTDSLSAVETFEGRGVVTSVTANRKHLIVFHEDIPGFMSAMEMPFPLSDTSLATGVVEGDTIEFTVEVDGPRIQLVRLEAARR